MAGYLRIRRKRFGRTLRRGGLAFFLALLLSACGDHGLHPVPITGISGTVTFRGQWPGDTEWVRILSFSEVPAPGNFIDFIAFLKGLSDPVPQGVSSYRYILELRPGTYKWIAVAWKAQGEPITSLKIIGTYGGENQPPPAVTVQQDKLTPGVDIVADFSLIRKKLLPLNTLAGKKR